LLIDFMKGLAIGMAAIAPGVSGGTLAVVLGIYEKAANAIANPFRDFRKKVKEFSPLAAGGVVGVLGFSNIISYLFRTYELEVKYLFIGLMLGTFPSLRKQADKDGFRILYLIPFAITLAAAILFSMETDLIPGSSGDEASHFLLIVLYGAIIGFGTIIPGISASFILMYLNVYDIVIDGISRLNPYVLIPAGIGFVLSVLGFANLISLLLRKTYGYTYYAIFGLTAGSILAVFPGFGIGWRYLLCYLLLTGGFILSYYLSNLEKPDKKIQFRLR
jgi:putative membrane protein